MIAPDTANPIPTTVISHSGNVTPVTPVTIAVQSAKTSPQIVEIVSFQFFMIFIYLVNNCLDDLRIYVVCFRDCRVMKFLLPLDMNRHTQWKFLMSGAGAGW